MVLLENNDNHNKKKTKNADFCEPNGFQRTLPHPHIQAYIQHFSNFPISPSPLSAHSLVSVPPNLPGQSPELQAARAVNVGGLDVFGVFDVVGVFGVLGEELANGACAAEGWCRGCGRSAR